MMLDILKWKLNDWTQKKGDFLDAQREKEELLESIFMKEKSALLASG